MRARYGQAFLDRGTRLFVMTDDLHHRRTSMERALCLADGVLSTYAPRLPEYWPRVDRRRVHWMPHAAGGDFLLPVEESPRPVVFVSGAAGPQSTRSNIVRGRSSISAGRKKAYRPDSNVF
jgi:hypothetical protein